MLVLTSQKCEPALKLHAKLQRRYSELKIKQVFVCFQVFELRSLEEMTEEWLLEKLKFFR